MGKSKRGGRTVAVALTIGATALAGWALARIGGASPTARTSARITVFAAASLTGVLAQIDRAPRYAFAGSDQLATQIAQGAPADVFAAASPKQPDALFAQGFVAEPVVFATNRLVLIVPKSNPAHLTTVSDVARKGVKLVVGEATVPIGAYTRTVLGRLRLNAALANVRSDETDVKQVLAKVALGEADAGFVYATDAKAADGRVRSIAVPASGQPVAKYKIAVVRASSNQAGATAFVREVLSAQGQARLRAAGFGQP